MNIKNIEELIKNGESETLEFKKSTALISEACKTLCAFLNGKGGTVLIGVNNNGNIIGQNVTDNTQQEIARALDKIKPHADVEVVYVQAESNHQVIVITVTRGMIAPYSYDDRPFLRNQTTTIRMPREKYDQLIFNRKPASASWERLTDNDLSIADLDCNRINQIVNQSIKEKRMSEIAFSSNDEEVLKKLKLIVNNKITNAGVVLFCGKDEKQFIQSHIKLARFRGIDKKEFIDNKSVKGNIFDLYEVAMKFLQSYLPVSGKVEEGTPFRVDKLAIPYEALREALVNALCHRDYSSPGGSVSLAIYDDRVEIANTGGLLKDISLEDLTKTHESHPRNPLISSVLYLCSMIEQWGRGTQEIVDSCLKAGNPKPKFRELTGSFTVILPLKNYPQAKFKVDFTDEQVNIIKKVLKKFERASKTKKLLLPRRKKILKLLKKSDLSSAQIAMKLKDITTVKIVQKDFVYLEKKGLVKRGITKKPIIWSLT